LSKFNKNTAAKLDSYREPHLDIINVVGKDSFISKPVDNEEMIHRLNYILTKTPEYT
jgi:hypothetical protein